MRPIVEDDDSDVHGCIPALPGDDEFPLWRIGCRVRLSLERLRKKLSSILLGGP